MTSSGSIREVDLPYSDCSSDPKLDNIKACVSSLDPALSFRLRVDAKTVGEAVEVVEESGNLHDVVNSDIVETDLPQDLEVVAMASPWVPIAILSRGFDSSPAQAPVWHHAAAAAASEFDTAS